jgi:hypothetical protein
MPPQRQRKHFATVLNSKSSNILRDECGGNLSDPLFQARCGESMVKNPPRYCERSFMTRQSQNPVCKTYCDLHRFCFLPLRDGNRCTNYRRGVNKKFCQDHAREESACGNLVDKYKTACGGDDDPRKRACRRTDDPEVLQGKLELFNDCYNKRLEHHQKCFHKSARSIGHQHFLMEMMNNKNNCDKLLWHDALENQEGFDTRTVYYDALEDQY